MSVAPVRDDEISTVTLRVALVTYLLTEGKRLSTAEIAKLTGLKYGSAWAMMNKLENSHEVPFVFVDGKWLINRW